ncbi:MAG: hypothetical protein ACPGWR_27040 [Ardenticatenaceae bacterium]
MITQNTLQRKQRRQQKRRRRRQHRDDPTLIPLSPRRQEPSPALREMASEVINEQMKNEEPPETKQTYLRLLSEGYSQDQAYHFLGSVLIYEMHYMLERNITYDNDRYVKMLHNLPRLP